MVIFQHETKALDWIQVFQLKDKRYILCMEDRGAVQTFILFDSLFEVREWLKRNYNVEVP
jgi:hypothetical protein